MRSMLSRGNCRVLSVSKRQIDLLRFVEIRDCRSPERSPRRGGKDAVPPSLGKRCDDDQLAPSAGGLEAVEPQPLRSRTDVFVVPGIEPPGSPRRRSRDPLSGLDSCTCQAPDDRDPASMTPASKVPAARLALGRCADGQKLDLHLYL